MIPFIEPNWSDLLICISVIAIIVVAYFIVNFVVKNLTKKTK